MNLELRLGEFVQPIGLISKADKNNQEDLPDFTNPLRLTEHFSVDVSSISTYFYEQLDALGPNLEGPVVDVVLSKSLNARGYTLTFNDPNSFKNSFLGELEVEFVGDHKDSLLMSIENNLKPFFVELVRGISKHLTFDVYLVSVLQGNDFTSIQIQNK